MKANTLLKHNIDKLLQARAQTRRDLAIWVRQSIEAKKVDPWISRIFSRDDREFQIKYLDRIADFFGLAVYQLFQPGISPLTERRQGTERRQETDRRISARSGLPVSPIRQLSVTPDDEALLAELHALTYEQYQHVRAWIQIARLSRSTAQKLQPPRAKPPTSAPQSAPPLPRRGRRGPKLAKEA